MSSLHDNLLLVAGSGGDVNRSLVAYTPLGGDEFKLLTQRDELKSMTTLQLDRLWLKPVARILQWHFRIDQRNFTTTSLPTLAQLEEDFKVATAITVDKFASNPEEISGAASVDGASQIFDGMIPQRAKAILSRYSNRGGTVQRG